MADVDDSLAKVCPLVRDVSKKEIIKKQIYRVSWVIHNVNAKGEYYTTRLERFFETEDAAKAFNDKRQTAAHFVGLIEDRMAGYPKALTLDEGDL